MAAPTVDVTQVVTSVQEAPSGTVQTQESTVQVQQAPDGSVTLQPLQVTVLVATSPVTVSIPQPQVVVVDVGTQGPQGPSGGGAGNVQAWANGWPTPITLGQPVYLSADDIVSLARANSPTTANVIGLVAQNSILNSQVGNIQTYGVLGGLSGLTYGVTYYLDPSTPGMLTNTPPSVSGQFVVEVGIGASETELFIRTRLLVAL